MKRSFSQLVGKDKLSGPERVFTDIGIHRGNPDCQTRPPRPLPRPTLPPSGRVTSLDATVVPQPGTGDGD